MGGASGISLASRALRLWALPQALAIALLKDVGRSMIPFADGTDNVIEQSVARLVEILAFDGEVMFATNRCINFSGGEKDTVALAGSVVTVTGNRVRANRGAPSLRVDFTQTLSAVGNITTNGADVFPASPGLPQVPAPYASFNAAT